MDNMNLAQQVAAELRQRGNKSVKSVFWNTDTAMLTVNTKGDEGVREWSFNLAPAADLTVAAIADVVEDACKEYGEPDARAAAAVAAEEAGTAADGERGAE